MCIAQSFSFLPPSLSGVISGPSSVTGFTKVLDSSLQRVLVTHRFLLSLFGFPCSRLLPSNPQEAMQNLNSRSFVKHTASQKKHLILVSAQGN